MKLVYRLSDRIADGGNNIPGAHSAVSSIQLGPGGGYQAGAINPVSFEILHINT